MTDWQYISTDPVQGRLYTGGGARMRVAPAVDTPRLRAWLARVGEHLATPVARTLAEGRNRTVRLSAPGLRGDGGVVVKAFGRASWWRRFNRRWRGTKAGRTWRAATHLQAGGVGTPSPVAVLEFDAGNAAPSGYYVSRYVAGAMSFRDALGGLFRENPECAHFMELLQAVAEAVRRMHDAGFLHNDLGNQNILLRHTADAGWHDVAFIDLNRGWVCDELSMQQRGRDISRIDLPSDLLRVFREMYWAPTCPPADFLVWETRFRKRYARHCVTRPLRHPVRTWRRCRQGSETVPYPSPKDMWIWDSRSGQAIATMVSRDRHRYYPIRRHTEQMVATLRAGPRVWSAYRDLRGSAYRESVALRGRIGVALSPSPDREEREMAALDDLGSVGVHVRFYHHQGRPGWDRGMRAVQALTRRGRDVSIALVQDRAAVLAPDTWRAFVETVVGGVGADVRFVEFGHAINRVKWGLWGLDEYRRLTAAVADVARAFPDVRFTGPAAIDFEYSFVLAALRRLPPDLRLWALSHHLYVDRRGAPEATQAGFGSLEKFALARAIARAASNCEDRLVVSEVNWPLLGTGVYSPVGSPYESPGERTDDPSVDEETYADYMLRYILIALCSGLVSHVVWWQLAAHGYGLIDDHAEDGWRRRPAYHALKVFMATLGDATFQRCAPEGFGVANEVDRAHAFLFKTPDGTPVCVAYAETGSPTFRAPFNGVRAHDSLGGDVPVTPDGHVVVTGRPVYVLGEADG